MIGGKRSMDNMTKMGYFTSLEAAKAVGISKKTLYRWEASGILPRPSRHSINPSGRKGHKARWRLYTQEDIAKIKKIVEKGLK